MATTYTPSIDPIVDGFQQRHHGKMDDTAWNTFQSSLSPDQQTHITPEMIPDSIRKIYETQADEQLNPWYKNEQTIGSAKLGNQVEQNQADYQNTIDQLNQGLKDSTTALADKSGAEGTWNNTATQERQKSLAANYQNKYQSAYNQASGNLQNAGLSNETNYGVAMPTSNIQQYQVSPTGQASVTGTTAKYNPFGIQNQLGINKQSASQNMANDYLGARIKNPAYDAAK